MFTESVMTSNHLILGRPLLLLPSIFPSIRVFSNESALCIRWPKYWSFSLNISPSDESSGLIFFRMDWLDLHAVHGTLKSLLQQFSSVAQSCLTLRNPHGSQYARPPCPSQTPGVYSNSLPIELVIPSSHLILCCHLLLLPSVFPSLRVFSNEVALCIRWAKYWSFSFSML